jgi:hypothetical protein
MKEPDMASTTGRFDVFLSYNSKDRPAVRELKRLLGERKVTAWLDEDELPPGMPWVSHLEEAIQASRSVAVCLGESGSGPWEDEEMAAALNLAVRDKRAVIPVLLPGASEDGKMSMFLRNRRWVDLRPAMTPEALDLLIWGITGKKPGPR